nr:unnamed protein product [Callosobruchus analis]
MSAAIIEVDKYLQEPLLDRRLIHLDPFGWIYYPHLIYDPGRPKRIQEKIGILEKYVEGGEMNEKEQQIFWWYKIHKVGSDKQVNLF